MWAYTEDNCDFYDPFSIKKKESKLSLSLILSENAFLCIYVFAYIEVNRDFSSFYGAIFIKKNES